MMRYLPGSRLLVAGSAGVALLAPESAAETACRLHTMLSTPRDGTVADRLPALLTLLAPPAGAADAAELLLSGDEEDLHVQGPVGAPPEADALNWADASANAPSSSAPAPDGSTTVRAAGRIWAVRRLAADDVLTLGSWSGADAARSALTLVDGVALADGVRWDRADRPAGARSPGSRTTRVVAPAAADDSRPGAAEATLPPWALAEDDDLPPRPTAAASDDRSTPAVRGPARAGEAAAAPIRSAMDAALRRCAPMVVLPDGARTLVDRTLVLGRQPTPRPAGSATRTVTVPSPDEAVSRDHLCLRVDGRDLVAIDLHSTNGTTLLRRGFSPIRLHPGEPTLIVTGDRLDLGDEIVLGFEGLR
ncbi:MAG: FHA domain-containing protein [Pseudoclavibacter caeni]